MKIAIVGASKVGRALSRALRSGGHTVTLRPQRRGPPKKPFGAPLLILAVRDGSITPVARQLAEARAVRRTTVVLHVAGAKGPEALSPLSLQAKGIGQAHPLLSFASPAVPPALGGALLLLDGDENAVKIGRRLARELGMVARAWPNVDRAAYHAAAGLAANGAAALADAAAEILRGAGAPSNEVATALGPLVASVGNNVARLGLPAALTGPVRRGDAAAIEAHLRAIDDVAPDVRDLYLASAAAQLPMARALGDAADADFDRVERTIARAKRRRRKSK